MTIPLSTKSYDHYAGTSALSVYPITFPTFEDDTLKVYITNLPDWSHIAGQILSGLKVFDLVLGTDYTTANINKPNTSVNLLDASAVPPGWVGPIPARQEWLDASGFLKTGYYIYIEFDANAMRPSVFSHGNQLVPALSKDMDRLAMHMKAMDHKMTEGFQDMLNLTSDSGAAGLLPVGGAAGEYLEFDGTDGIWQSGLFQGFSARYGVPLSLTSSRDALLYIFNFTYVAPLISLSVSPSASLREKGSTVGTVSMTATITKKSDDITDVTHYRNGVLVHTEAAPNPSGGPETYVDSTPFSDNMSFYSRVVAGGAYVQSNTVTYPFVYPFFWGAGAQDLSVASIGGKQIVNKGTRTPSFVGSAGEVLYYAYPASYGDLSKIEDVNGFDVTGAFTKKLKNFAALDGATVSYRIYELSSTLGVGLSTTFTFII